MKLDDLSRVIFGTLSQLVSQIGDTQRNSAHLLLLTFFGIGAVAELAFSPLLEFIEGSANAIVALTATR